MTKSQQLLRNTLIVGIGKGVTVIASFFALPVYTRYLSAGEYGVVDLVLVYMALLVPLISVRLDSAVFRWLVDARGSDVEKARVITNIGRILLIGLGAFTVIYWVFNIFKPVAFAALVFTYFTAFSIFRVASEVARGLGKMTLYTTTNVISGLGSTIIGVTLVVLGCGVSGVLAGYVVGSLSAILFLVARLRLYRYIVKESDSRLARDILRYSLPMIVNGLSWTGVFTGTKVIISFTLGVAANGIYAVVGRFTVAFQSIYDVFNTTWQESVSVHIDSPDRDVFFSNTINAALVLFSSAAAALLAILSVLFPVLVGEEFHEAYKYIPLLLVGPLANIAASMIGAVYVAKKDTRSAMNTTLAGAAVSLGITAVLISSIGLWAPAIGAVVGYLTLAIFRYFDIRRYGVKVRISSATVTVSLLVYVLGVLVYFMDTPVAVSASLAVGVVVVGFAINRNLIVRVLGVRGQGK